MGSVAQASKDIWDWSGFRKVIPVNLQIKKDIRAVMSAGLAMQCLDKYPDIDKRFGQHLLIGKALYISNTRVLYVEDDVILLPTKRDWRQRGDYKLIESGLKSIEENMFWEKYREGTVEPIVFPRIGCGLGTLEWNKVKPIILEVLGDYIDDIFFTEP